MLQKLLLSMVSVFSLGMLILPAPLAAQGAKDIVCDQIGEFGEVKCDDRSSRNIFNDTIGNVIQILIFIIGGVSVLIIIIGGLMYVLSGGDPNNTARAKDAILYAIIGLVVAVVAQGIVTFIIGRI